MSEFPFDIERVLVELGDPKDWKTPDGYRCSLALCVMDSIWSIGIKYQTVLNVLDRYLSERNFGGLADAQVCIDGPSDFLGWAESLGPSETMPENVSFALKNKNRTSSADNAVLKSAAVIQACQILQSMNVETTIDLVRQADEIKPRWLYEIPGQRSGVSWKYLLMLCGSPGVKPDRMVMRFLERMKIDTSVVTADTFVDLIVEVIDNPKVNATVVDHRIWTIERAINESE